MGNGVGPADDSVVRQQDGVVVAGEGADGLSEGLGAGGFVGSQGCGADGGFVLGDESDGRDGAGHGKGSGVGRMTVDDGAGAGARAVDLKMKQQFAGSQAVAGEDVAAEVRQADIGWLHVALAHHGGGAEQKALAEPDADVAAVSIDILPLPQLAAYGDDLKAQGASLRRAGGRKRRHFGLGFSLRQFPFLLRRRDQRLLHS